MSIAPHTDRPLDQMTYNECSAELEAIVGALESNQLELEESLVLYQRGVELLADLRGRIANAEQRVSSLMGQIDVDTDERDTTLS
jgi:exodeoxyribonuclease VII small subunit